MRERVTIEPEGYTVCFFVRGEPKAQPRPRSFVKKMGTGKNEKYVSRMYDAGTAEGWKASLISQGEKYRPVTPLEGPLRVSVTFYLPRPKKYNGRKHPDDIYCTSKPDRDNLEKAVLDALKVDGWFRDDAQVVCGEIVKKYHVRGGVAGAQVKIEELLQP